ncbi:MAG: hypothetical protein ABIJ83_00165 [Patescibacteria group bacterium]
MNSLQISQNLKTTNKKIFTLNDLKKILNTKSDNTAYKRIPSLINNNLIYRISKGIYGLKDNAPNEFEIASFLYKPSYISLESALNFYGVLTQVSFVKTSLTTKRSKLAKEEYQYYQIDPKYFWGFEKIQNFLIASREKALIDQIYFASKKITSIKNINEYDLSQVSKQGFIQLSKKISFKPFQKLLKNILNNKELNFSK